MPTKNRDQSTTNQQNPNGLSSDDPVEGRRDIGGINNRDQQTGQITNTATGTAQRGTAQPKVAPSNTQGQQSGQRGTGQR